MQEKVKAPGTFQAVNGFSVRIMHCVQQRKLSRRAAPGSQHPQGQGEEAGGAFAPSLKLQQLGQHLSAKQGARRSSGVALAVSGCCGDQKHGKKLKIFNGGQVG